MENAHRYRHLQVEDRQTLASLLQQGESLRSIARALGRSPSSLSRERRRNSAALGYGSVEAAALAMQRRRAARPTPKLTVEGPLWLVVRACLSWRWSPQQIAGALRVVWPDNTDMHVSHETIYTTIYAHAKGALRTQLIACLRQGHKTRLPRSRGTDRRGGIPEMVSIHVRPPGIEDRVMPGHWEGDLIKGEGNRSAVGVLVERSSRLVLLAKMDNATAASALKAFTQKLNQIATPMRQSLTYDQGKEMSQHAKLTQATGIAVYFCDPHSPWQRGTCENTNGLIRQYLPKGTDLSRHSQAELDAIADSLNSRPRATHGFNCPLNVFAAMLEAATRNNQKLH